MTWFGQSRQKRKRKSQEHSRPQIKVDHVESSHVPSHSLYTLPTASATTYSVQTSDSTMRQGPYHHRTTSSVHLSSGYTPPAPQGLRPSSPLSTSRPRNRSLSKWQSYTSLSGMVSQTKLVATSTMTDLEHQMREYMSCSVDAYGAMLRKLDHVITSMDEGLFTGKDDMVVTYQVHSDEAMRDPAGAQKDTGSTALTFFSKAYLYNNSRLPPNLPPLQINAPAYALLRLAAQYSHNVYRKQAVIDNPSYVGADWRNGTKAMVIKSLAVDDIGAIVIAIRGTQSFRDWAVNMKTAPTSPQGFLDDASNLCHAGFLSVAQRMVQPVAAGLRNLLEENPIRASYSLVLTGHSAGGAVASLLYCHMLSTYVSSDLAYLRSFFSNVHCVTFGAPPVSLRPLHRVQTPTSIFFSCINEGDPVPRADKSYVASLLNLYLSPAPTFSALRRYGLSRRESKPALWRVPPATLSVAGQIVLLRKTETEESAVYPNTPTRGVEACVTTDEVLKQVVFGDPLMHMMDLYARRIHALH